MESSTATAYVALLAIVAAVAVTVRRIGLPYTVGLVLFGLAMSVLRHREMLGLLTEIRFSGETLLLVFLPPLLFEAAYHLRLTDLRRSWKAVTLLALPGVLLTAVLVAALLQFELAAVRSAGGDVAPLPLAVAFLFGAIIAATDPVAVIAMFRTVGAPHRLSVYLESESLLNDGVAIVVYLLALPLAADAVLGVPAGPAIDTVRHGVLEFARVVSVGVGLGLLIGGTISQIMARIDDDLVETTLTVIAAYGSYVLAENAHASGALGVVTAGLVVGNIGVSGMSPTTRLAILNFWDFFAFLANSLVFLLIGLTVSLAELATYFVDIVLAVGAVLAARAIVVYSATWIVDRRRTEIPAAWRHVMFWGGLRGAIALALVLSAQEALGPLGPRVRAVTFGVMLFTLLVQGLTIESLMARLGLTERHPVRDRFHGLRAQLQGQRASWHRVEALQAEGLVPPEVFQRLRSEHDVRVTDLEAEIARLYEDNLELETEAYRDIRREALRVERTLLRRMSTEGTVPTETLRQLVERIDAELDELRGAGSA